MISTIVIVNRTDPVIARNAIGNRAAHDRSPPASLSSQTPSTRGSLTGTEIGSREYLVAECPLLNPWLRPIVQ